MTFFQATSDTLPLVTFDMILQYLKSSPNFNSAEFKGVKAGKSTRDSYGDQAVGFVELKREGPKCSLRARMTPEHKVRTQPYHVSACVDEEEGIILTAQCHDCVASSGGCKHELAFISWLYRRSNEPATTEVVCYWKKSVLAQSGPNKPLTLKDMYPKNYQDIPAAEVNFRETAVDYYVENGIKQNMLMLNYDSNDNSLSLHVLMSNFKLINPGMSDVGEFLKYCSTKITADACHEAEVATRGQYKSSKWFELRYGRVTASTFYDSAHCHTKDGSLVEKLMGSCRPIETKAMSRGKRLEPDVVKEVEAKIGATLKKCGFLISAQQPYLGASPDAICEEFCVEVKCPVKNSYKYILKDGNIAPRYEAQLLLQMHLRNVEKGLFVVADASFEENHLVEMKWVQKDLCKMNNLVKQAKSFWENNVYPLL